MIHAPAPIADATRYDFSEIEAYWRDPSKHDAEKAAGQAAINNLFSAHDARVRAALEARWAKEGQA